MKEIILIVEDNKTIAMYEKSVLEAIGLNVLVAFTPEDVKKILSIHKNNITLAVVDINLPDCEDCMLDFLLKLNISCIAMTGSFHPSLREKIINKKLIDYIVLEDDQNLEYLKSTIIRILNNKNTNILIVDDSKASRYSIRDLLQHQNYTVLEAADGLEALKILQEHDNIKVALIDYEMPKMNGVELTRLIRKEYSRMELSIFAISIHTESIITVEFLKAGANDFITKPFIKEEVIARIGVNLDMIDQHQLIQKEIVERKKVEQMLEVNNESLSIILDESILHKKELMIVNEALKKSQEQAQIANKAKSNFLANMSHEIRTPMNAILGFIDILYKQETSEEKKTKLKVIQDSGNSLLTIINDILDFSKIESGKLQIEKILFETTAPFTLSTKLFYEKSQEKNINIELNIDEDLPDVAYGDVTRIQQVYSNLVSNAIKFSPQGRVIKVDLNYDKQNNRLFCSVEDRGIGIAEKNIQKVFSAFEQEDSSTTRKFGGTGLGLSISKALTKAMGGDIGVESTLGEGSRFYFLIDVFSEMPSKETIEDFFSKELDSGQDDHSELSGKILLVEDNKSNQLLMNFLLQEFGFDVVVANDGLEALALFDKERYSLILMDENMPNMNGIAATQNIRAIEKEKNLLPTPIIAVTANAFKEDKARFLDAGMDDYVSKPVDSDELLNVIKNNL